MARTKKDVSAVVSGMGIALAILVKLWEKAKKRGITEEEFHALARGDGERHLDALIESIIAIRQPARPKPTIEREFTLALDYSKSPADTLRATGCDYIYSWMLEHCPEWKGTGKMEVKAALIDMGADWHRDEALAAIGELGLLVAPDNCALWTLSKDHPDLQREIWVVDPGTVWTGESGGPCMAYLDGDPDDRNADLLGIAGRWARLSRVLALRKPARNA